VPDDGVDVNISGLTRAGRLLRGWSVNLLQMLLGIVQQVALIPVFLHYWSNDTLAGWLAIYAAGNLVFIADCGLHLRAINRFFSFRASDVGDARTANFFAAMLRIYVMLVGLLIVLLLSAMSVFRPSASLGFTAIADFDLSFAVMILGTLLAVPANLATALYRARGHYERAVRFQIWTMVVTQLGQLAAITLTGSLLVVTLAYAVSLAAMSLYLVSIDAPKLFPFLHGADGRRSWHWIAGQFRLGLPFGIAWATELALTNAPVLLVSAFVSDRVAVVQWGLTRVVAGLIRALCTQITLPLAAELGHDHAVGLTDQLRSLYARGSVLVSLLACVAVSGLLAFWPDFFSIWTHGAVPDDPSLTASLLLGTALAAPSILALSYANYSNRGNLLAWAKSLQFAVFLGLSLVLIPTLGPLGAALAIVLSEVAVQFGFVTIPILRQTLDRPFHHLAFLIAMIAAVTLIGWAAGIGIRNAVPGGAVAHLVFETALWAAIVMLVASPLSKAAVRNRLIATIPQ
jgi:O-antigen/teichoic acid export membrane protein